MDSTFFRQKSINQNPGRLSQAIRESHGIYEWQQQEQHGSTKSDFLAATDHERRFSYVACCQCIEYRQSTAT